MITLSYIRLHPQIKNSAVQVRGATWVPWATLIALVGLTILMLFDASTRGQIIAVLIVSAVLIGASFLVRPSKESV